MPRRSSSPSRRSGSTSAQSRSTAARSSRPARPTRTRRLRGPASSGVMSFTTRQVHWQSVPAWVSMPSSSSSPVSGSRRVRMTAAASPMR